MAFVLDPSSVRPAEETHISVLELCVILLKLVNVINKDLGSLLGDRERCKTFPSRLSSLTHE